MKAPSLQACLDRNCADCHHSPSPKRKSRGPTMLEVEMKFPIRDFAAVESRLAGADARQLSTRQDIDQYFNAPDRDFARTDEALRIRGIGSANFVTYKGPKRDAQTKTRTEIEVPLAEGAATAEAFAKLLTHLGYRPVAVVQKQ